MAQIKDQLSGISNTEPEPNSIQSIEEARIYRIAYADGTGQGKVGLALRFPGNQLFLVENPREHLPLQGVNPWFTEAFFGALNAKVEPEEAVPTSEELLADEVK